ncbi:MAG: DUF1244 domain-containing protein [Erythrobacter sp.]
MNTPSGDTNASDLLDQIDDKVAAAAFRRMARHLQQRHDAQNIELMGLAGFCRNCLADWIRDAGFAGDKSQAREVIHGMPMDEWKQTRQQPATAEQIEAMEKSVAKNRVE